MYFCGATIAGPFFEYKDYINLIEKKEEYQKIPSTVLPALKRLFTAFCNEFGNIGSLYWSFAII